MRNHLENTEYELLPALVGLDFEGHTSLLDGHHRWRAYRDLKREPLVLEISFRKSASSEPVVVAQAELRIVQKAKLIGKLA